MPASAAITLADHAALDLIEVRRHRLSASVVASLGLHLLVLLLIAFGLLRAAPPPADLAIPVDLVRLGPVTAAPYMERHADLPQQPAPSAPDKILQPPHPAAVLPSPLPPTPIASLTPAPAAASPAARQALAAAMKRPHEKPPAERLTAQPKTAIPLPSSRQPAPVDALTARLKKFATLKLASAPLQPGTDDPLSDGLSNTAATSAHAATGPSATYSARDFLRAQVIRHWNLRAQPSESAGWTVSIHLQLRRDGSVAVAEIIDPARYRLNRPYFDFALSARNAVLLAAPLAIPPGQYDLVSDIVLPFSARDVLR